MHNSTDYDDPVSTGEAARILEKSESTVRANDRRGLLTSKRVNQTLRIFSRAAVVQLRDQQKAK
jgi:DNA-binding transcriptional MerR regulator